MCFVNEFISYFPNVTSNLEVSPLANKIEYILFMGAWVSVLVKALHY